MASKGRLFVRRNFRGKKLKKPGKGFFGPIIESLMVLWLKNAYMVGELVLID